MALNWNVHTPIGANSWYPLASAAPVTDESTLLTTVRLPIIFRGTRAQFNAAFRYGIIAPGRPP